MQENLKVAIVSAEKTWQGFVELLIFLRNTLNVS